jgi:hypothetical protein
MTSQALTRIALAMALAAAACASSGTKAATATAAQSSSTVLTMDEIMKTGQPTAFRVIQTVRPQWLLVRRQGGSLSRPETIKVYVQGNRFGEVATLEQMQSSTIKEIRHLDGRDATIRFGTGHMAGAILVTLR